MCVFFEYKWKEFQFWSLKIGIKTRAAFPEEEEEYLLSYFEADQYEKASVF